MMGATWTVGTRAGTALLDLDGTLCDSADAITSAMRVALKQHGVAEPDASTLRSFVGPPFAVALGGIGLDEALIPQVVATYRRHYAERFMLTSPVFDGVQDALEALSDDGVRLLVATSKPQETARRIVAHLDIERWIDGGEDGVFGADVTRAGDSKGDVIGRAMAARGLRAAPDVVMVGDRVHDVEGARRQGLATIGARWGYAPSDELEHAGVAAIAITPADLVPLIRGDIPAGAPTRKT